MEVTLSDIMNMKPDESNFINDNVKGKGLMPDFERALPPVNKKPNIIVSH